MDKLESLTSTLQNITLYDIKSMYNQAKNVVLNVSEMEAKVREATNDDPWGASSTLMQEIAQGTFHFQYFNEIMPSIYSRFMEKEARQWRQIYKALQLLEYLIKHGSERVVDDARSHISTLKMLRNFHYIDDKGKDEGINVRNRSRELVELLSDVEKIRAERRKAKANKNKYIGVGNDGMGMGMSFETGGGGRYGGFGSDSLGGGGGSSSYGNDYSGGGGSSSRGGFSDNSSRRQFEEYDAGGDEVGGSTPVRSSSMRAPPVRKATAPPPPPPAPAPVVDLLGDFDDTPSVPAPAVNKALPAVSNTLASIDDDDFADFQAAPVAAPAAPVSVAAPAPAPTQAGAQQNIMALFNAQPIQPTANPAFRPQQASPAFVPPAMNMGGHRPASSISSLSTPGNYATPQHQAPNYFGGGAPMRPVSSASPAQAGGAAISKTSAAPAKSDNFGDLWSMSLGSASTSKPASGATKSIKDLEKEKATAGLWGQAKPAGSMAKPAPPPAFGSFGNAAPASSGGDDDLLL